MCVTTNPDQVSAPRCDIEELKEIVRTQHKLLEDCLRVLTIYSKSSIGTKRADGTYAVDLPSVIGTHQYIYDPRQAQGMIDMIKLTNIGLEESYESQGLKELIKFNE